MPENLRQNQAIVIGGSIAGLLTARVLADYYSQVIVLEKEHLPIEPNPRKGVPQSVQPHTLLVKGYRLLNELFPGIERKLHQKGAIFIDWVREFYYYNEFGWNCSAWRNDIPPSELISVTCSRPLLEWAIREKVKEIPQIKIFLQHKVIGLIFDSEREEVIGVRFDEGTLTADLIVDASGRNSQSVSWLKDIGFSPPPETVVNPFVSYATSRYKQPPSERDNWKILVVSQLPPKHTRLGYLAKIEQGELIATLGGYGKDRPPIEREGFLDFARSLRDPAFYQVVAQAEPSSPISAYGVTANRLRHFERVNLPNRFIAVGDAVCTLCPVYGQGITTSAIGAIVLKNWLKAGGKSPNTFQSQLAKELFLPWTYTTANDLPFPTTQGERKTNFFAHLMQMYTAKLGGKATTDLSLYALMLEVGHLLRSPLALYHPSLIIQTFL